MLFLPVTFVAALVIIGARVLLNSKSHKLSNHFRQLFQQLAYAALWVKGRNKTAITGPGATTTSLPASAQQAKTHSTKSGGILKQVHFADVIATSSSDLGTGKQAGFSNAHQQPAVASKAINKNGKNKNKSAGDGDTKQSKSKKDTSVPEIEEFDLDSLVEVTNNYSVVSKANLARKQQQQQQLNKKMGRKRHNSEGSKLNYSSEQLFKMIAASCLSKEEVEMAIETLLNKLESGEAQWKQPKSDPLLKLKNQLRDSEAALTTEVHNHEQARARLVEVKQQLQSERSAKVQALEELASLRKEFNLANVALELARADLATHRHVSLQTEEEKMNIISKLEQDNTHLQALLANSDSKSDEAMQLRRELDDKLERLHRYELMNDSLTKNIQDLEARLRSAEIQIDQMHANEREGDYEARAKIAELESDRNVLKKSLKDHALRLNEVLNTNDMLDKSLKELAVLSNQQDDMIKRLREERHINEASMQRTLCEMETELRALHEQLSSKSSITDERYRKELNHFEKELNEADQREQRLTSKMKQLRDHLSELFPDLRPSVVPGNSDDWVQQYLMALKKLTTTVDELRLSKTSNNNGNSNNNSSLEEQTENSSEHSSQSMSSKRSGIDKSTQALHTNGKSSRVGSPSSNGRSSRASSNHDREKRMMESRLVETITQERIQLDMCIMRLENETKVFAHNLSGENDPELQIKLRQHEEQINDLKTQRALLDAHVGQSSNTCGPSQVVV